MLKPLAMFDVDKTMFNGFSYFSLAEAQTRDGLLSPTALTLANECLQAYGSGQVDYEDFVKTLLDIYAEGLKGRPSEEVVESTDVFFKQTSDFFGYVEPTVDGLRRTHELAIVTGGTQFSAVSVGKVFGIEIAVSSVMGVEDNGRLTGRMTSYLATRHEKREAIHHLTERHSFSNSVGFGDSEGDIEMLRAVEHGICIQPTPGLRDVANNEGWTIVDSQDELASSTGLWVVRQVIENN